MRLYIGAILGILLFSVAAQAASVAGRVMVEIVEPTVIRSAADEHTASGSFFLDGPAHNAVHIATDQPVKVTYNGQPVATPSPALLAPNTAAQLAVSGPTQLVLEYE